MTEREADDPAEHLATDGNSSGAPRGSRRTNRMITVRSLARTLGPFASAGISAALGVWLWKRWRFPVNERTVETEDPARGPHRATHAGDMDSDVQHATDGAGNFFHRTYRLDIDGLGLTPSVLISKIGADPAPFMPPELAQFEKTVGAVGMMAVDDEFVVHIRSPWDGPVRVTEVSKTSFTFVTLDGHMEAGVIRFSAQNLPEGLRFQIESWARSADELVDALYDDVGVAREAQRATWTFFCMQVAEHFGGTPLGPVEVITEREPQSDD